MRHCQVPCAKIVNTRVEVDFLWKFVSLLLKPQMFLDRRFSTHCWDKRGPDETHGSHEKNGLDDKSTIHKDVESRVQNRSGCTAQNVARFRAHLSNGHTVEYVWQDAHTGAPRETSRKTIAKPWVVGVKCHASAQRATDRVLNVCTRTKNKQEQRTNHGPNSRGSAHSQLAKSRFEKHFHACIVASHVVNRARDAYCPQSPS